MATSNQKIGTTTITGNPKADWSHASAYLAKLYSETLTDAEVIDPNSQDLDLAFRSRLLKASGVDELSPEDQTLAASLTEGTGVDLSYWPGGANYRVSTVTPENPLGLPGDLWAAVEDAEDGAWVAALVQPADDGNLDMMVPGGRGWEPMTDLSVIEGYSLVGVSPDAVELYHNYDRENALGVISSYPLAPTGPFPSEAQLAVPMPREIGPRRGPGDEFWKNAGETHGTRAPEPVVASIVIVGAEDLPDAVSAAAVDPDLRWYVERRVKALGLEADLPWQRP